ncbi:hypothetical protein GC101_14275 [Paenibacillus sp. LMG 31459]|uniref:Uncharacterized protein n=1 Tax=Paenibacillus phytohabitans TaxID=2654978 RepID=A0ABX1YG96_9BACL|nr:hypothetical protein [Paenibacillus phytohabitans]NOU80038.1 hypothetical protein [Paenibacillus phytohabitans]
MGSPASRRAPGVAAIDLQPAVWPTGAPGARATGRTSTAAAADPRAAGDQSPGRDRYRVLQAGWWTPGELSIDAPAVAR